MGGFFSNCTRYIYCHRNAVAFRRDYVFCLIEKCWVKMWDQCQTIVGCWRLFWWWENSQVGDFQTRPLLFGGAQEQSLYRVCMYKSRIKKHRKRIWNSHSCKCKCGNSEKENTKKISYFECVCTFFCWILCCSLYLPFFYTYPDFASFFEDLEGQNGDLDLCSSIAAESWDWVRITLDGSCHIFYYDSTKLPSTDLIQAPI